eukprot:11443527-Alexandrium_andersonii.AAC.1
MAGKVLKRVPAKKKPASVERPLRVGNHGLATEAPRAANATTLCAQFPLPGQLVFLASGIGASSDGLRCCFVAQEIDRMWRLKLLA